MKGAGKEGGRRKEKGQMFGAAVKMLCGTPASPGLSPVSDSNPARCSCAPGRQETMVQVLEPLPFM